jgi:hypothetical protein
VSTNLSNGRRQPALHIGPLAGQLAAQWNPDIERVTIQLGADASLHLEPEDARQLARELFAAVYASEGEAPDDWQPRKVTLPELLSIVAQQSAESGAL